MTVPRVLAVVCLLVLAGCANPFGAGETPTQTETAPLVLDDDTTETPSPNDGGGDRTDTPDGTATPDGTNASNDPTFPPGVSEDGLEDANALLQNHSTALERTGFVATGNGSSVVSRSGILVDVETEQRNRVATNGSPYEIRRDAGAGPFERSMHAWSNGSVEYVHRQEDGESNYTTGEPRPPELLAGNGLLGPYVRGGEFEVREVRNTSANRTLVVLRATGIANATVLERAVTDDAEEITAYEAAVAVDEFGRIHVLEATIEYVLEGQTVTQEFRFELESVGDVEVPEPDWLDEAKADVNETA